MTEFDIKEIARLAPEEVFLTLRTTPGGLSYAEAGERLKMVGPNSLHTLKGFPTSRLILRQFTHFLALLLLLAAALAFTAEYLKPGEGMATLGWAIVGVVFINAVFSFLQEYKAERAVQALHQLLPQKAWAKRSGQTVEVLRTQLVPGDVLLLEEGEQVPADARLIEAATLRVDNSALTGESHAKPRVAEGVQDGHALDIPNLIFAGTTVLSGRGRAVVFATGMRTEFGKIAHLSTSIESGLSPLQQEIVKVTHLVASLAVAMGLIVFVIGLWVGLGFWVSAIFGMGIIVANVPEGLLPTVTLALAMGSQRMARRHALIKQLTSVETLGCTTVICTDKTGTLTQNRMRVDRLYVDEEVVDVGGENMAVRNRPVEPCLLTRWQSLFDAMTHCNNARRLRQSGGQYRTTGDPTEVALLDFSIDHHVCRQPPFRKMAELPFDSDRKRMSTVHWKEGRLTAFVKGAPESIIPLCTRILTHQQIARMTSDHQQRIFSQSRAFAHQAYRVLAIAQREIEQGIEKLDSETVEQDLTFLGLVAMMDPPHPEVPEAVTRCRQAGVRIIMITGDHPLTALALAQKIGLMPETTQPSDPDVLPVIEGQQLDAMRDDEVCRLLTRVNKDVPCPVFARMAPRHKMRVVTLLKDLGEVVAVTGDGVNDAPALRKAHIGVAMGIAGTDVAKETADMILLDDNFATVVNAIEEGRAVYANIRKFVTYVLASNVPEIVPYLGFGMFSIPLPLTIPQILAVDLGTDIVPALALGVETPHPGIMEVPPRSRSERLLSKPLLLRSYAFLGVIEAAIAMTAFFWFLRENGWTWGTTLAWTDPLYRQATTVTLAAIVIAQVANVFACRSERTSMLALGLFTNPLIWAGIGVELLLLALIVYTPLGQGIFGTGPLPLWIWPLLLIGAAGLLLTEEGRKYVLRRRGTNVGVSK